MDRLTIDVGSCNLALPSCADLARSEYGPASFYAHPKSPLSVVDLDDWIPSHVVGYNARRCTRLGYEYMPEIDRHKWIDDMHELRSSARERQGRPMPLAYMERFEYATDPMPDCPRHGFVVHGIIDPAGHLVAYVQVYQCGDCARLNSILGHVAHLEAGVMWLLMLEALEYHRDESGARHGVYYTHESGHGGGLRYFKERLRFRQADVDWRL